MRLPLLALPLLLTACDTPAVDLVRCAAEDDRLSIVFQNPTRAKAYLRRLERRLRAADPDAAADAADLVGRVIACTGDLR